MLYGVELNVMNPLVPNPHTPKPLHKTLAQAEAMDYADPAGTSRVVQALTAALDDAERFHPPEAALQTQQYLATIRCAGAWPCSQVDVHGALQRAGCSTMPLIKVGTLVHLCTSLGS